MGASNDGENMKEVNVIDELKHGLNDENLLSSEETDASDEQETEEQKQKKAAAVKLFHEKNAFLGDPSKTGLRVHQLDIDEFFSLLFERDDELTEGITPFEEVMSKEYKDIWLPQIKDPNNKKTKKKRNKGNVQVDYTGYGCWRYNPIVFYVAGKKTRYNRKKKVDEEVNDNKHHIIFKSADNGKCLIGSDGEDAMDWLRRRKFAIMAPITYVGKSNTKDNARYLYAFAFDLDGIDMQRVRNLFFQAQRREYKDGLDLPDNRIPPPNIITNSGNGFHLYYLMSFPVPLYERNWGILDRFKARLTEVLWNDGTSNLGTENRQSQNVFQGFRLPGTRTKFGEIVTSWHYVDIPYYTIADLNRWLGPSHRLTKEEIEGIYGKFVYDPTGVTRMEAQRLWPEWYARVIVNKKKGKAKWHVNRAVYDWWLKRMRDPNEPIKVKHRYWSILTLVVYAVKCDIPKDEAWNDAVSLVPRLEALTFEEDNHFTVDDVEAAFRAYKESYCCWPIDTIEKTTGLEMPRNVRNGLSREDNLEVARLRQKQIRKRLRKGDWREGNGRKVETVENSHIAQLIGEWMDENPGNTNKSQCARDVSQWIQIDREIRKGSGLKKDQKLSSKVMSVSRVTVNKWWDLIIEKKREEEYVLMEEAERIVSQDVTDMINYGAGVFGTPEEELAAIE